MVRPSSTRFAQSSGNSRKGLGLTTYYNEAANTGKPMKHASIVFVLLWLAVAPAFGATPSVSPANYDIEVLIFETQLPEFEGSELWTRPPRPADTTTMPTDELPPTADF